jgi:hypothetical protein
MVLCLSTHSFSSIMTWWLSKFRDVTIYSFIPLSCAECYDSLPFPWVSPISLCYKIFPATLLHQLFFYPTSLHFVIYFLVYLLVLFFSKLKYNTLLGILFSSILCACPNERNLYSLIFSVMVVFFNNSINFFTRN